MLAFNSIDLPDLAARLSPRLPHRGIAVFILIASLSTGVWLFELLPALARCVLLTLLSLTGLIVAGQTVMMLLGGYVPSAGETALFVAPFLLLSVISVWLLAVMLRHLDVGV